MNDVALFQDPSDLDPSSLEGIVQKILFVSSDGRFRVALLKTGSKNTHLAGQTVKISGKMAPITVGDSLSMTGRFVDDAKRKGLNFQVEQVAYVDPVTSEGVTATLQGLVPGLGPATAGRLVQALGGADKALQTLGGLGVERIDLFDGSENGSENGSVEEAVADHLSRLNVRGMDSVMCQELATAWIARKENRESEATLASLGLPVWLRSRVMEEYGSGATRLIKEDPYRLMRDISGVGFKTADEIAAKLGLDSKDPKRAESALIHVLMEAAHGDGHTCMSVAKALQDVTKLLNPMSSDLSVATSGLARAMDANRVVTCDPLPMIAIKYLRDYEHGIVSWFSKTVNEPLWSGSASVAIARYEAETGHTLDEIQKQAVNLVADKPVCIVTGGPGVGKTECSRAIVSLLIGSSLHVALCAPTGRAAKRLEEATGQPASTIHRLLGYGQGPTQQQKYAYNKDTPLPYDAILVDEASMVDSELMYALVQAMTAKTRLILVGDMNQLPPVGPGAPFRDLVQTGTLPTVKLSKIFRQVADSRVVQSAHRILDGKMISTSPAGDRSSGAVFFLEEEDPERVHTIITKSVQESIPEQFQIEPKDIQVLVPMHKSLTGTIALNSALQEALNPETGLAPSVASGERVFRIGDRVRQTKNDYKRGIVNGDMGYVCEVYGPGRASQPEESPRAVLAVKMEGSIREQKIFYCTKSELLQLQLAYAGTVHSSQGGEYAAVIVVISKSHWIMLTRTLLYTALTRAKKLCVIVGDSMALKRAIGNARIDDRTTLLGRMLKGEVHV